MNESSFFQDLAMLMTVAGIVSVVFARLRWPKVLGYIAAGILMSKFTWGGSFLADEESVRTIGQLGVVFLMFGMGLEFSTSQMKRIKSVALPTALIDTMTMTWIGYMVGHHAFGWGNVPSLFLGVAICDSATTMLAKVIGELKWGNKPFVPLTLGTSVCEDIVCVGLIAIITGVATGKGISVKAAFTSLGGLFVFFLAVIAFGLVYVPRLLKSVANTRDSEALTLTILGCSFAVSWMAYKFDFSLAIGAFLVGIIGAASDVRNRLAELAEPMKAMFAAMFFVSIGLLVYPAECWNHFPEILLVTAVVVVGKFVNTTVGALLTGESVKTSIQVGMSLAQIGEFAFMVAAIYATTTGDTKCPIYNIVVAVSILTTLLNPLLIKFSAPAGNWVDRHIPFSSRAKIETYRGFVARLTTGQYEVTFHKIVRASFIKLGVIAILNFAVAVIFTILNDYDWSKFSTYFNLHKKFVFCLAANLFIVGMAVPALRVARLLGRTLAASLVDAGEDSKFHTTLRQIVSHAVTAAVVILLFCEMSMINMTLAPEELWARWAIRVILLGAAVFGWRFFAKATSRALQRFEESMSAEERREKLGRLMTFTVPEHNVSRLALDLVSPAIGGTVVTLNVRAKTGATIVAVERDGDTLRNIGPDLEFQAGDVIVAVGESSQIAALKDLLGIVA